MVERLICNEEATGSIPVGSTKSKTSPLREIFTFWWKAEPYFALAKWRAGVATEASDDEPRVVTTKDRNTAKAKREGTEIPPPPSTV